MVAEELLAPGAPWTSEDIERERRRAKAAREQAKIAHPFDRNLPLDEFQEIYDDCAAGTTAFVAFADGSDRIGLPAVDLFEAVPREGVRRIYIRRFFPSLETQHMLGREVPEIAASVKALTQGYDRVVYMGVSMGAFHALLIGTLSGADCVVGVNPITSLLPHVLEAAGDHRWDDMLRRTSPTWLAAYGDIPWLWQRHPAPEFIAHVSRHNWLYAVQVEHVAANPRVQVVEHDEYAPLWKMSETSELSDVLTSVLFPAS